jgi:hypothetical protein
MGLFKLLTFPLSGPLWVAKVVHDQAERQMYDVGEIHRQMAELERQHRVGEIDDEMYEAHQEALFQRLLDAREYHRDRE